MSSTQHWRVFPISVIILNKILALIPSAGTFSYNLVLYTYSRNVSEVIKLKCPLVSMSKHRCKPVPGCSWQEVSILVYITQIRQLLWGDPPTCTSWYVFLKRWNKNKFNFFNTNCINTRKQLLCNLTWLFFLVQTC